jgi:AcrR family transcriptional regulator
MSRREEAKAFNRALICAAAQSIIRDEGMEKLTMRHLAEKAGVSLRTPYNLLGSKTDVLIALLDEANFVLVPLGAAQDHDSVVAHLLGALNKIEAFFDSDEEYYRTIYESIMASDHPEARSMSVNRAIESTQLLLARAVANAELRPETDSRSLGRHLAIELLAILGMWGSGFFSNRESIAQVRRAWCAALLHHCSETARPPLESAYRAALETKG